MGEVTNQTAIVLGSSPPASPGLPQTAHLAPVYAVAAIAFIAYMLRKLPKAGTRLDHLKAGYEAEVAVSQELDPLMQ